jgi:hypothetical protein
VRHVLARRCMMTEGESARVSPSGAARVDGVSTRLFERPPSVRRASAGRDLTEGEGVSERRDGSSPHERASGGELRGTQRNCPFFALLAALRVHQGSGELAGEGRPPKGASSRARGRDHPVLASRPARPSVKRRSESRAHRHVAWVFSYVSSFADIVNEGLGPARADVRARVISIRRGRTHRRVGPSEVEPEGRAHSVMNWAELSRSSVC